MTYEAAVLHRHGQRGLGRAVWSGCGSGLPRVHGALSMLVYSCSPLGLGRRLAADLGTLIPRGGVPVEMASGFSAIGRGDRRRSPQGLRPQAIVPHNAIYALLGAGFAWFGWFGFNGGSGTRRASRGSRFTNTLLAPAATLVVWFLLDLRRGGQITAIGAARDHRRLRGYHAGGRLRQPDGGAPAGAICGGPEYASSCGGRGPAGRDT